MARRNPRTTKEETHDAQEIWEALGVSEKDWEGIQDFLEEVADSDKTKSDVIEAIDKEFTTQKEKLLAAWVGGCQMSGIRGVMAKLDISDLFGKFLEHKERAEKRERKL